MVFLATSLVALGDTTTATLDKEVQGVNKEQLEMKEIKTNEVLLKNQKLDSGSEVTNDAFQNQNQKIKVVQGEKSALEDELSEGVEKKSFIKYILGGIAVIAIAVAL